VSAEFLTGLFALLGASVGGAGSYLNTLRAARDRRADAAASRTTQLEDTLRQEAATFIKFADLLDDRIRDVSAYERANDVPEGVMRAYVEAWESFVASNSTLSVHSAERVESAARDLFEALAALCNQIDEWVRGEQWTAERFDSLRQSRKEKRAAFLAELRSSLAM
jgi:hypothetical protein